MVRRGWKTGIRITVGIVGLCLFGSIAREWNKSCQELRIASEVVKSGGYIFQPLVSLDDLETYEQIEAENSNKPVMLFMAENRLTRLSKGYLGTRILAAHFSPDASTEFATILKESTSLDTVLIAADWGDLRIPPRELIQTLADKPVRQYVFDRIQFTKQDISDLSHHSGLTHLILVNSDVPYDSFNEFGKCKLLKAIEFAGCNFHETDPKIDASLELLRKSGIDVTCKRLNSSD